MYFNVAENYLIRSFLTTRQQGLFRKLKDRGERLNNELDVWLGGTPFQSRPAVQREVGSLLNKIQRVNAERSRLRGLALMKQFRQNTRNLRKAVA
jgi:hypothetical protein